MPTQSSMSPKKLRLRGAERRETGAKGGGRENGKETSAAIFAPNLQWTSWGEFYCEISFDNA